MAKFSWTVPYIVAEDGELIAGHGRVRAAAMLGQTNVPVIRLSHLDEAERRTYHIADNKLTPLGTWDETLLLQELQALLAEDFGLSLIETPEDGLDALLANADDRPAISDDAVDAKHRAEGLSGARTPDGDPEEEGHAVDRASAEALAFRRARRNAMSGSPGPPEWRR
jgi:ParB-like chromosome segregation protein Spo0J